MEGNWWLVSVAAVYDRRGQPISLGGSSSVRTQIPDFTAAKRRKNYGRMIVGKIMAWGIFNHGDHGEHRGKLRARVHSRREWGRAKKLCRIEEKP